MIFRISQVRMKLFLLLTEIEKLHTRIRQKAELLSDIKGHNLNEASEELHWTRAYLSRADYYLKQYEDGRPVNPKDVEGPRRPVGRPRKKRLPP